MKQRAWKVKVDGMGGGRLVKLVYSEVIGRSPGERPRKNSGQIISIRNPLHGKYNLCAVFLGHSVLLIMLVHVVCCKGYLQHWRSCLQDNLFIHSTMIDAYM